MQKPKSMLGCAGRGWSWSHQREQKLLQSGSEPWRGAPTRAGAPAVLCFPVGIFPAPQVKHEQTLLFHQGFPPPSCKCFCCKLPLQPGQPFRERNATCKMRRKKQQVKPKPNGFQAPKVTAAERGHRSQPLKRRIKIAALSTTPPSILSQAASRSCL